MFIRLQYKNQNEIAKLVPEYEDTLQRLHGYWKVTGTFYVASHIYMLFLKQL